MKIYYIANIRFPTEKAHGIHIAKMCEAFASLGHDVELVVTTRKTPITTSPFEYYKVQSNFKIKHLPCIDIVRFGRLGFLIQSVTFALSVLSYVAFKNGYFYTRDEAMAFFLKIFGKDPVWEAHMGHENIFAKFLLKTHVRLVVITQALKSLYAKLGWPQSLIHVAPDAVDFRQFDLQMTKSEIRKKLGIPEDKIVILYTGHLYSWKGAHILAEAAPDLSKGDAYFVGGTDVDVASFKERFGSIANVHILGRKPHHEVPVYLKAADLLIIPNSAKEDISRLYTSPMKLFEYMASGVPIVASDLPSLREILDESQAYFFKPDDAKSLAQVINGVIASYPEATSKAKEALTSARDYSWDSRALNVANFISE